MDRSWQVQPDLVPPSYRVSLVIDGVDVCTDSRNDRFPDNCSRFSVVAVQLAVSRVLSLVICSLGPDNQSGDALVCGTGNICVVPSVLISVPSILVLSSEVVFVL